MSQQDVLEILESSKVPLSVKEISDALNERQEKISFIVNRLLKYREVEFFELNKDLALKFYKTKRRMRLYYVI